MKEPKLREQLTRTRRGIFSEVREFDGDRGRMHLVRLDYKDDSHPPSEEVIWELEPSRLLLVPSELPSPSDPPMRADDFDALPRAAVGDVEKGIEVLSGEHPPAPQHREEYLRYARGVLSEAAYQQLLVDIERGNNPRREDSSGNGPDASPGMLFDTRDMPLFERKEDR